MYIYALHGTPPTSLYESKELTLSLTLSNLVIWVIPLSKTQFKLVWPPSLVAFVSSTQDE